jgi:serine/threonine-protein kinase
MLGQIIGTFRIEQKIGEGGMGAVYRGCDLMLERDVAIKVLRPELARQPELVARFRSEAITLARLNHSSIATLYNFLRHGDDYFMVMEFVRGVTLEEIIRRQGAMGTMQAVRILCQALEGIAHAHALGVIHRDIKPANLMLTANGEVKVMDFGIARVLGTARQTKTGRLIGTLEYMSPEQACGQETDARADIYSLGILLYEMLTGRVPFESTSDYALMRAQVEEDPPSPREFINAQGGDLSLPIELAIMRALTKDPAARFQSAAEFRAALISAVPEAAVKTEPAAMKVEPVIKATRQAVAGEGLNADFNSFRFDDLQTDRRNSGFDAKAGTFTLKLPSFTAPAREKLAAQFGQLTSKHYGGASAAMLTLVIGFYVLTGRSSQPDIIKPSVPDPAPVVQHPAPVVAEPVAPVVRPLSVQTSPAASVIEPMEPAPVDPLSVSSVEPVARESAPKRKTTSRSQLTRQQAANNFVHRRSASANPVPAPARPAAPPQPDPTPKPSKFDKAMKKAGKAADVVKKFKGLFQ